MRASAGASRLASKVGDTLEHGGASAMVNAVNQDGTYDIEVPGGLSNGIKVPRSVLASELTFKDLRSQALLGMLCTLHCAALEIASRIPPPTGTEPIRSTLQLTSQRAMEYLLRDFHALLPEDVERLNDTGALEGDFWQRPQPLNNFAVFMRCRTPERRLYEDSLCRAALLRIRRVVRELPQRPSRPLASAAPALPAQTELAGQRPSGQEDALLVGLIRQVLERSAGCEIASADSGAEVIVSASGAASGHVDALITGPPEGAVARRWESCVRSCVIA